MSDGLVHLEPLAYVHVSNLTTNVTSLVTGPTTLVLQQDESLVGKVEKFVNVPPQHYAVILNPVKSVEKGKQCQLKHGYQEIRLHKEPFPLYPGEKLVEIKPLPVVRPTEAIRLLAMTDFKDTTGVQRKAGDLWQLDGPLTYVPVPEAQIKSIIKPVLIEKNHALHLRATKTFVDREGTTRVPGQEWVVARQGGYVPDVYEEVVRVIPPYVLTPQRAIHVKAKLPHKDSTGVSRAMGDVWLVTSEQCETFIEDVTQEVVKVVDLTVLSKIQYCVVRDPVATVKGGLLRNLLGELELRTGPRTFFLHPTEAIAGGIRERYLLEKEDALVLKAERAFDDVVLGKKVARACGTIWMIEGPCEYVPPIAVKVVEVRKAMKVAQNEGLYVQDLTTGEVRTVVGPQSYLLKANERLWEKPLDPLVLQLLQRGGGIADESVRKGAYFDSSIDSSYLKGRDLTRTITYRIPHNTAVQVNNFMTKASRVVVGPNVVMLGPHENFNVLSLSAGKPKVENALKSLVLFLGPDFMTDEIVVETSDHARLVVRYAVNNYFDVDRTSQESLLQAFRVPDYVGIACRELASKIRGAVARISFDEFHRGSTRTVRKAVFGVDENDKIRPSLKFPNNGLVLTNIDIQNIEPVEAKMQDLLSRSVQMAIEISTRSLEEAAKHEANRQEQIARGKLEVMKIVTEQEIEDSKKELYELRASCAAVNSTGQAKAEAQANADKLLIEGTMEIVLAGLRSAAKRIDHQSQLEVLTNARQAEVEFIKAQNDLEIFKATSFADLEVEKFQQIVESLKPETIVAIAQAGPEMQVRLLEGLGLQATIITDGSSPVNLFNLAKGLVSRPNDGPQSGILALDS